MHISAKINHKNIFVMKGVKMNHMLINRPYHGKANIAIAMMFIAFVAMLIVVYMPEFTSNLKTGVGGTGLDYNQIP
jgi:hypothetical protein